ncbi:MAG: GNAT family N-acetyltransferase [Proteobacteria bacterium]|nr:GNAT family N-acetyltransferase [Pseudomonadota bacterium]
MSLTWTAEGLATWDAAKANIIADAPAGAFPDLDGIGDGDMLGAEWWRVESDGTTVGYGWLDASWGWAPILLAVKADQRKSGVGAFIIENLQNEARTRGLAYLFNVIPATHPDKEGVTAFLAAQGFEPAPSDPTMLRLKVAR